MYHHPRKFSLSSKGRKTASFLLINGDFQLGKMASSCHVFWLVICTRALSIYKNNWYVHQFQVVTSPKVQKASLDSCYPHQNDFYLPRGEMVCFSVIQELTPNQPLRAKEDRDFLTCNSCAFVPNSSSYSQLSNVRYTLPAVTWRDCKWQTFIQCATYLRTLEKSKKRGLLIFRKPSFRYHIGMQYTTAHYYIDCMYSYFRMFYGQR